MLEIALELAENDPAYEDIASKFFEHFIAIADAMNHLGGTGLWHEEDGFYYDQLLLDREGRSRCGCARRSESFPSLPSNSSRKRASTSCPGSPSAPGGFWKTARTWSSISPIWPRRATRGRRLLAIPSQERLLRVLRYVFDENEFLSPYGVRSMSKAHEANPFVLHAGGEEYRVGYVPGESDTGLFGGNSNWRGPVWMPVNYLLIEALERYHHFYGDTFLMEFPTGSGRYVTLKEAAQELSQRLVKIFVPDASGARACHGSGHAPTGSQRRDDMVLFHEYYHAETGEGLGASHQTGWTALVARLIEQFGTLI